jgi:hypothetical protein
MLRTYLKSFCLTAGLCILTPLAALADCPHCYEMVKVRVEFRDSTTREVFYEWHQDLSATFIDPNDSAKVIRRTGNTMSEGPLDLVALIEHVYNFEGITFATTPELIDSVPAIDIDRIVLLAKTGLKAAGTINVFDRSLIDKLSQPPVGTFGIDGGSLDWVVFVNYNADISDSALARLATLKINGYWDISDAQLDLFGSLMGRRAQTPEDWQHAAIWVGKRTSDTLLKYAAEIASLREMPDLDSMLQPLATHTDRLLKCAAMFTEFASSRDAARLREAAAEVVVDTSILDQIRWDESLPDRVADLNTIARLLNRRLGQPPKIDESALEAIDILVVRTYYD